jgi:hypothetical protein
LKKRSETTSDKETKPAGPGSGTVIYINAATWIKGNDSTYQCDFNNIFKGVLVAGKKIDVYHVINNSADVLISDKALHIYQGRLWATSTNAAVHIFFQPAAEGLPFLGLKIKVVIQ